jgi:predicted secreted hydrolase
MQSTAHATSRGKHKRRIWLCAFVSLLSATGCEKDVVGDLDARVATAGTGQSDAASKNVQAGHDDGSRAVDGAARDAGVKAASDSLPTTCANGAPTFEGVSRVTNERQQVTVEWLASRANGPVIYRVFRRTSDGSYDMGSPLVETAELQFVDTAVALGVQYFYLVRAYGCKNDQHDENNFELPGNAIAVRLPEDEGPHDASIEWWYYTGHLSEGGGKRWGFEVTFFKLRADPALLLGNFAITDHQADYFFYVEMPAVEETGTSPGYFLDVGGWRVSGHDGYDSLSVDGETYALKLDLSPLKPAILHGLGGMVGSGKDGSFYSGQLTQQKENSEKQTYAVSGQAWMDHQWWLETTSIDDLFQAGWDWISLQLDDSTELMAGTLHYQGQKYTEGTWVDANGKAYRLQDQDISIKSFDTWTSAVSGNTYPMNWTIEIPSREARYEVIPVKLNQELNDLVFTPRTYWEGEVEVRGVVSGNRVTGRGYVELTGYDG